MRLPLPDPRDLVPLLERGAAAVDHVAGLAPRLLSLVADVEALLARVDAVIDAVDDARASVQRSASRVEAVVSDAEALVGRAAEAQRRVAALLDVVEPTVAKLQPTFERLASTTSPREVDAVVGLIDRMPLLAGRLEADVLPVLDSLATVAPDMHDLLDVSRELNELIGRVPGLSRIKRRVDEEQEQREDD